MNIEELVRKLPQLYRQVECLKKQVEENGSTVDINVDNLSYDNTTQELIITENDGTEYRQSLVGLIDNKVDKNFLGWVQYNDTQYTDTNRRTIIANTRTKLTNNAGGILDLVGLFGAQTLWNPTTNKFENDNSGDKFMQRVSFIADPTLNNRNLTLELDIGGTQGVIWSRTIRLARGAGIDTKITENLDFYTLGTFIANGGDLFITCDGGIDIYDTLFLIQRTFRNN